MRVILDALSPVPAAVLNHLTDLLAWNDAYDRLMRPLGIFESASPNIIRFLFTNSQARDVYRDWPSIADEQVAYLHRQRHGDPEVDVFANSVVDAAGDTFARVWKRRPLDPGRPKAHDIAHPDSGVLRLNVEALEVVDCDYQRLIVYTAADTASAAGLDQLLGRHPGALHAISESPGTDSDSRPATRKLG